MPLHFCGADRIVFSPSVRCFAPATSLIRGRQDNGVNFSSEGGKVAGRTVRLKFLHDLSRVISMKPYRKSNIALAKELRNNMTPWERKLWYCFLRKYTVRFQRQKAIGDYIVDFYCAKARLVVELDGGGHYSEEKMEKDFHRTEQLEQMNLRVMRFSNLEIDRNFDGVCQMIDEAVRAVLGPIC